LGIWFPVIRETGEIEIVQAEGVADLISIMGLKDAEHIGRRFRDGSTVHMLADIDGMGCDQKINRLAGYILDEPAIFGPAAIIQVGKDDGTETDTVWTKEDLRAEMEKEAEARFSVDKVDQLKHEITIDFVRLGDTDEYKQFKDLQKVRLYDTVIAVDPRIDLSVSVQVTEIEFDAVNERITAMKLSNIEAYNLRNTAGFNVLNNSITGDKLTDEAGRNIVGTIKEDAVAEANNYTSGSVQALRQWVNNNFEPKS
jgi:hypothetical protein